jgi:Caspase domain
MADSRSTIPKIHAILVGINVYAGQRSLKSAVKDAGAFKKVLEKLDSTDLTLLLDVDAKHDSIMTALESLQYKDGLTRDDAIVFFFSGYAGGAKGDGQEDGKEEEETEGPKEVGMICPTDFMEKGGISDQMLVKLFDRISKACGNNIVSDSILRYYNKKLRLFGVP